MTLIPKVLSKIIISTSSREFLADSKIQLQFMDFDNENEKICDISTEGCTVVENGDEFVVLRNITSWNKIEAIDILF